MNHILVLFAYVQCCNLLLLLNYFLYSRLKKNGTYYGVEMSVRPSLRPLTIYLSEP